MDAPSAPSPKSFPLHFVLDDKRFFWRNPNLGVTLTDAGRASSLSWQAERGEGSALWTDITGVTMTLASDGKAAVNQCRIAFRDGRSITVTDTGADGTLDADKTPVYRDLVRALHARLAQAPPGGIAFTAGVSEGRYRVMQIVFAVATVFFIGGPLVLLALVPRWEVLGVLIGGAALVWPSWKIVEANRPRSYDPRHPPQELME